MKNDNCPFPDRIKLPWVLMSSLSKFRDPIPHDELQIDFQNSSSGKKLPTQKIIGSERSTSSGRIIATLKNTSVAMVSTSNDNDLDSMLGTIQRLRNRIDRVFHEQPNSHQNNRLNLKFSNSLLIPSSRREDRSSRTLAAKTQNPLLSAPILTHFSPCFSRNHRKLLFLGGGPSFRRRISALDQSALWPPHVRIGASIFTKKHSTDWIKNEWQLQIRHLQEHLKPRTLCHLKRSNQYLTPNR
jgi:hypothetical protein